MIDAKFAMRNAVVRKSLFKLVDWLTSHSHSNPIFSKIDEKIANGPYGVNCKAPPDVTK